MQKYVNNIGFLCEHPRDPTLGYFSGSSNWCGNLATYKCDSVYSTRDEEEYFRHGLAPQFACDVHKDDLDKYLEDGTFPKVTVDVILPPAVKIGDVFILHESKLKARVVRVIGSDVVVEVLGRESALTPIAELFKMGRKEGN